MLMLDKTRQRRRTAFSVFCLIWIAAALPIFAEFASPAGAADPIRVVVWDEQQSRQKTAYPNFLGNEIAEYLKSRPGLSVKSVKLNDPKHGLAEDVIGNCQVLIWWGHVRQHEIKAEEAQKLVKRVQEGKMSMIILHSAHWSAPFIEAMNARAIQDELNKLSDEEKKKAKIHLVGKFQRRPPKRNATLTPSAKVTKKSDGTIEIQITRPNCCFPYCCKLNGRPSQLTTLKPDHPIAKGIPAKFSIPKTEMYDEPFHVPAPDAVIFEEKWDKGEHFRAGMVWALGKGQVFYFRPGHETYPIFKEKIPLQIIENAVRWMGK